MNEVVVLKAIGGNDLSITCRIFPDMETAKARCDEIFGFEGHVLKNGVVVYSLKEHGVDLDKENGHELAKELFTRYYGGCGGAYDFVLTEVEFDTVFTHWDLD